jgi:hypothetical protein
MNKDDFWSEVMELWSAWDDHVKHFDTTEAAEILADLKKKHLPALLRDARNEALEAAAALFPCGYHGRELDDWCLATRLCASCRTAEKIRALKVAP